MMMDVQYMPTEFDVLLTDVSSKDLHHDISKRLSKLYLSDITDDNINTTKGIIWGPNNRVFVAMVVRMGSKAKYVHFLVDTGSPNTYICQEVFTSFGKMIANPNNTVSLHINNKPLTVLQSPEKSHFEDVNILGTTFMKTFNSVLNVDFGEEAVTLTTFD